MERLFEGANFQIPFNADEINITYQFGEQSKAEMCAELTERDHSIKTRLAKAKKQAKQPTVTVGKSTEP